MRIGEKIEKRNKVYEMTALCWRDKEELGCFAYGLAHEMRQFLGQKCLEFFLAECEKHGIDVDAMDPAFLRPMEAMVLQIADEQGFYMPYFPQDRRMGLRHRSERPADMPSNVMFCIEDIIRAEAEDAFFPE